MRKGNRRNQSTQESSFIIDERAVGGPIRRAGPNGEILSEEELAASDSAIVWRIHDYSGGRRIPEPDEDYLK